MTFRQLRYIIDIARTGSISQSAANFYTSQPNLSGIITQIESELGIQIFNRTNRGVTLTNDGLEFLAHAQKIVADIEHLERKYTDKKNNALSFRFAWTISLPMSEYISRYLNQAAPGIPVNIHLIESSQLDVLNAVSRNQADSGKIIIPEIYLDLYEQYCKEQGLMLHKLWKIKSCMLFSAKSKLAKATVVEDHMITDDMIEIQYGPNGLYDLPNAPLTRQRTKAFSKRRIFYNDRGNLMDMLTLCPNTYVYGAPIPSSSLKRHHLAMRHYSEPVAAVVEALVYPDLSLSKETQLLIQELEQLKDPGHPYWVAGFGPEAL